MPENSSTSAAGKSLAARHSMFYAAEGGHFSTGFSMAPMLYCVLPGGGAKILSMVSATKVEAPSASSQGVAVHTKKTLEAGLLTNLLMINDQ